LRYAGSKAFTTNCWWDPAVRIPAGTYSGCSATRMRTKTNSRGEKREGVFLPSVPGHRGIFVHMGTNSSWSDGCIVLPERQMLDMWNDIEPKNGRNVTVHVIDKG
ncbi:MAG: hypothetical protein CMJ31_06220, partial [Phycisphaerae bacterium]|nr:hypothetical protein [Phycisphaerae bacterium]